MSPPSFRAGMGLAPTGLLFALAMLPNALWGLAMPTLQSLMTQRVSEFEQGQLQGANNSVGSMAGVMSPLFFGGIYAVSIGPDARLPHPGAAFLIAALVLLGAAIIGWRVARRAQRDAIETVEALANAAPGRYAAPARRSLP